MSKQLNQIQVQGCPVMVDGLKGEYHVNKYQLKKHACPFDAGFDLYLSRVEPIVSRELDGIIFTCHTDIKLVPIAGVMGLIHERSSSFSKLGGGRVRTGIVDPGYSGEILVQIVCRPEAFTGVLDTIKVLQAEEKAVAQMLFLPFLYPVFVKYDQRNVDLMQRKNAGFGSTDILGV